MSTIFVPNVRYHGCPQCGQVWECDACTVAVLESQKRSRKEKAGLSSGVRFGARQHAWKKVLYCPECEQKAKRKTA